DSLRIRKAMNGKKNLAKPGSPLETYGELMKIHVDDGSTVTLEFSAFTPVCCSHIFRGTISQNGTAIEGEWPAGRNQTAHRGLWIKVEGDSCISPGLNYDNAI